ncbi:MULTISPECIES: hypothetical protein [unclassified Sphingobium]|uniref:hypothetical protein n=1 Tax=unclassified Sphingobium TaxID=2611147 RepID=UPI000A6E6D1D|nr:MULTISPECIES: hypothetical protein [unclassified Sphingobium]
MPDQFLAIPDQMIGATLFPQEAVDWLAFGAPEQGARFSLSLDDQILSAHQAAGTLLLAMWGDDLPAYVHSPSSRTWYQVPALYWGRQAPEELQSAMERPVLPDRLPGQPRPIDPRYGIDLQIYPHHLPASDLIGQAVAFRKAEVERYCSITGPVFQWKLKNHGSKGQGNSASDAEARNNHTIAPLRFKVDAEIWYRERVAEARRLGIRYSREEDQKAGRSQGISRPRVRELRRIHALDWTQKKGRPTR